MDDMPIETHPFEPFLPPNAKVLIMGTFPPQPKRWSMEFYYPNRTNDFWPMMGLIFNNNSNSLFKSGTKEFDLDKIKQLLNDKGIALNDTGYQIRRLAGNASDKFLDIIQPVNLYGLLEQIPLCHTIVSTGEKAATVIGELTETLPPKMGEMTTSADGLEIWRMPSTSRAYPLKLDKKADYYRRVFSRLNLI